MNPVVEHLMDLHDAASEVRHTDGAPAYNSTANNARNAFRSALEAAIPAAPQYRFPMTYCSQCGKELGPGNEGVSHCSDHATKAQAPARNMTQELQQKCSDWGTYWRASDAHGVELTQAQAVELLQDALGVEVEIKAARGAA